MARALILFIFSFALCLPLLFSDRVGGKISVNERRFLATFPQVISPRSVLTRSFWIDLQVWFKDNLWGRITFQQIRGTIDYRCFNVSSSPLVHIGDEGWLFYRGDKNIELALGTNIPDQKQLENIKLNQELIQTALNKRGIDYVLVLTPSKVSVYPEYIKGGTLSVRETYIDIVTDYLRKNTTIPVINLKPALIAAKSQNEVFLRTETHWNYMGAYYGYSEVIHVLQRLNLVDEGPVTVSKHTSTFQGEFAAMMGSNLIIPPERMDLTIIENPTSRIVTDGEKYQAMLDEVKKTESLFYASFTNDEQVGKLLLIGDSFFYSWRIPDLFAENFNQVDYVSTDRVYKSMVDLTKPDIVILERTERGLFTLANFADPYLYISALTNPQAIMSVSANALSYSIAVENSGEEGWSETELIRLGMFIDGKDSGLRVQLPDNTIVEPGGLHVFKFEKDQIPEDKLAGKLGFRMLQEGFSYFGNFVEVSAPAEY